MSQCDLRDRLKRSIHKRDIDEICLNVKENLDDDFKERLFSLIEDDDNRVSANTLWLLTHIVKPGDKWFLSRQDSLVDYAMTAKSTTNRRLLLTLLNRQEFDKNNIRPDFLDFCLGCLLSPNEPIGVKSACMKVAFKMCKNYPELTKELRMTLEIMRDDNSPAIKSSIRNILMEMK